VSAVDRSGQLAVVTGAARGIGLATAERLRGEGAAVVAVDLDPLVEDVARDLGDGVHAAVLDVADPEAWEKLDLGPVDVLAHCAAILVPGNPVVDVPLADFERALRVNLVGTFVACKAVLPRMLAAGRGWIVTIASIAAKEGTPYHAPYSASKGGVLAFTKALSREVAASGITVNTIAPAAVDTRMSADVSDADLEMMLARIPMRRICRPDEVAALVSWIASPECSFTTGFCFDLSGGRATY
jgi:3-oxoacyl-[acyl-carrier protein] reductase